MDDIEKHMASLTRRRLDARREIWRNTPRADPKAMTRQQRRRKAREAEKRRAEREARDREEAARTPAEPLSLGGGVDAAALFARRWDRRDP